MCGSRRNASQISGRDKLIRAIYFPLQVLSLCASPWLLDEPKTKELFAPDAIERAKVRSHFLLSALSPPALAQKV